MGECALPGSPLQTWVILQRAHNVAAQAPVCTVQSPKPWPQSLKPLAWSEGKVWLMVSLNVDGMASRGIENVRNSTGGRVFVRNATVCIIPGIRDCGYCLHITLCRSRNEKLFGTVELKKLYIQTPTIIP